ncbi:hypothetical protein H6P81_012329 [Aristolochia fimbriata]|uniref:Uncharacterized protein n=1 Tax=Aristolochia fimbriata TaxID=158543 RepID=A0AAV7EEA3_ARIFI|nr:hypothetical protein H6P81_012329 [Aristolochia fimbriata]
MPSASNISTNCAPETLKQSQRPTERKILTTRKTPERKSRDGGKSRLIEEKRPALIDPNENRMERSGDLSGKKQKRANGGNRNHPVKTKGRLERAHFRSLGGPASLKLDRRWAARLIRRRRINADKCPSERRFITSFDHLLLFRLIAEDPLTVTGHIFSGEKI